MLDGMVDLVWSEVAPPSPRGNLRPAIRKTAVSAYQLLVRYPWAASLAISLGRAHPARLRYIEAILGKLRKAGFSTALAYHGYHAIDSHVVGFTMWYDGHAVGAGRRAKSERATALPFEPGEFPYLAEHTEEHRTGIGVGLTGTDEFTFVLDLILDGLDRARGNS